MRMNRDKTIRKQPPLNTGICFEPLEPRLLLSGSVEKHLEIIGRLPRELGIVAHDLVLLHMKDGFQPVSELPRFFP